MSSSETVLSRFVRRVESQSPLPDFARWAWPAMRGPEQSATAWDYSALASAFQMFPETADAVVNAVPILTMGNPQISELSALLLSQMDSEVLSGLVYGFHLPEMLFSELSAEAKQRYWQRTLIRSLAVNLATRRLRLAKPGGLFTAAMLADVGSLVLQRELKQTYAQFIADAAEHGHDLYQMEFESLGFDQRVLAARLLDQWSVTQPVVQLVGESLFDAEVPTLAEARGMLPDARCRYVLHAGDLLSDLLSGQSRGKRAEQQLVRVTRIARQVFGWELAELQGWALEVVDPAARLASCFGVPFDGSKCSPLRFDDVWNAELKKEKSPGNSIESSKPMTEAGASPMAAANSAAGPKSARNAATAVAAAGSISPTLQGIYPSAEASSWSGGAGFGGAGRSDMNPTSRQDSAHGSGLAVANAPFSIWLSDHTLHGQVQSVIEMCRSRRQSLSLKLAQIDQFESLLFGGSVDEVYRIQQGLMAGFEKLVHSEGGRVVELGDDKFGFLLPGLDRIAANRIGQEILRGIRQWSTQRQQTGRSGLTLSLGCASTDVPARNFQAPALIEAAARCLENVQRSAGNGLKSIDIYY